MIPGLQRVMSSRLSNKEISLFTVSCSMGKSKDTTTKSAENQRQRLWGPLYHQIPFPLKLHMLVSSEELPEMWWIDSGKAFAVDREGYKKNIMSVFFDQKKFRSLQTLLWKYDFCTVAAINNSIDDVIVYHHQYFMRDKPDLCRLISRKDHIPSALPESSDYLERLGNESCFASSAQHLSGVSSTQTASMDDNIDYAQCRVDYHCSLSGVHCEEHLQTRRDSLHSLLGRIRGNTISDTSARPPSANLPFASAHERPDFTDDCSEPKRKLSRHELDYNEAEEEDCESTAQADGIEKSDTMHKRYDNFTDPFSEYTTGQDTLDYFGEGGSGDDVRHVFEAIFDDLF